MSRLSLAVVVFLLVSPAATAEIFRCVGEKGVTVYQNFRCELDSIGSSATAQLPPEATNTSSPQAAATGSAARSQADGVRVAASEKLPSGKVEPRIGMTRRQVRHQSWGEPSDITAADSALGQPEVWTYADKRTIRFDDKGRVAGVQQ